MITIAAQAGLGDRLFVGTADLSGDIGSLSKISTSLKPLVVTGINKSAVERIPGARDGEIDFSAWFNPSAGAAHPVLRTLPTTDIQVTYFRGAAIGNAAASCIAKEVDYKGKRGTDGSFSFDVNAVANSFGLEWGRQLTAGVRTDTTATNGTGLDAGASSTFDGQAYLHVIAFTGTSATIKLQDSPDNVTYTDTLLGTFPLVIVPTVSRLTAIQGGTIARYVRVVSTGSFSNLQFVVNFSRNESAVVF